MKKFIFPLFFLSFLISCSPPTSTDNEGFKIDSINFQSTDNEVKIFKGLFATGKFIDCENPRVIYTVNDQTHSLDSVYKEVLPAAYPQQTMFIEVRGNISANENKDVMVINEIIKAERKNPNNACALYDYWCMGNEPFWQIEISETGDLIDLYEPMENKTTHFTYSKPEKEGNKDVYSVVNGKDALKIVVTNEFCNDGMSERKYNFKVEVLINGRLLNGCAIAFNEPKQ